MNGQMRWYNRLLPRSILVLAGIELICGLLFILILRSFMFHHLKVSHADRLQSVMKAVEKMPEEEWIQSAEGFSVLFPKDRVLLLDENSEVLYDSSAARTGAVWDNQDIKTALSGKRVIQAERPYVRIAVPIQKEGAVQAVLYTYIEYTTIWSEARHMYRPAVLGYWIGAVLVLIGYACYTYRTFQPLKRILNWLRQMSEGRQYEVLNQHFNNEYQEMVDSVEHITKDLLEMNGRRNRFVSNVSHELKTPLSSMKVLTDTLLLQDPIPSEMAREFLQDIDSEIDRQNSIISDLLTLIRLDGAGAMNIAAYSLNDIIDSTVKHVRPLAEQKHISLEIQASREVVLQCDEVKLTMALTNLIQNGIKYNKENGKVTILLDANLRYARITVKDTGIGIAKEHFPKLFDQFYRVDTARDRDAGGTGLGLSIVKQIILLHHGSISVDSQVGEGTEFQITLPLKYTAPKGGEAYEMV